MSVGGGGTAMDVTIAVLKAALDAAAVRHAVISHNVANVETPGFRARGVRFEEDLARVLERLDGEGGAGAPASSVRLPQPRVVPRPIAPGASLRADGNTVSIDVEMAEMAENAIRYQALSRLISDKFTQLRTAITEGRR